MTKLIIILVFLVAAVTVFSIKSSKQKKWPIITVTLLLIVELILCLYRSESQFIHQITGMEYTLTLFILWILAIAPHVDDTIEKSEKDNDTTTDQNDKA
jgi:heme A synthase